MSFEPYLRAAGDGTLELLVPSAGGAVHIFPYCFHTEEDAANWLATRKGREQIGKIRKRSSAQPELNTIGQGLADRVAHSMSDHAMPGRTPASIFE